MKVGLSSTTLRSYSPLKIIQTAARLGYDGAELWAEQMWSYGSDPVNLGEQARKLGLRMSLHGPSRDLNVTSSNPGIQRESRSQYRKCLQDAAHMGADIVNLHPGTLSGSHDESEEFILRMIEYSSELAKEAERLSLSIALEVMERRTGEYVTTIPDAARIAQAVGHPAFGITVDLAHLFYSGVSIELQGHEPHIYHVHISGSTHDKVHVPLAQGIFDLGGAIATLRSFYRGIVVIESYAKGAEMETAEANKQAFERLVQDSEYGRPDPGAHHPRN